MIDAIDDRFIHVEALCQGDSFTDLMAMDQVAKSLVYAVCQSVMTDSQIRDGGRKGSIEIPEGDTKECYNTHKVCESPWTASGRMAAVVNSSSP